MHRSGKDQQGFTAIETVLILIIIAIIGFIGWYAWHSKQNSDKMLNDTAKSQPASVNAYKRPTTIPSTWKTYTNPQYKLSLAYPADWKVQFNTFAKKDFSNENDFSANATSLASICYLPPNITETCSARLDIVGQALNDTIAQVKKNYYSTFSHVTQSNITIDGHPAVEFDYQQPGESSLQKDYYVEANNYTYVLPTVYTAGPPDAAVSGLSADTWLKLFESVKID